MNIKLQKLYAELKDEKTMNEMLRNDQCQWTDRVKLLEEQLKVERNERNQV